MATSSVINRFSTIATDPLRSFRFFAEFTAAEGTVFDSKITSGFTGGFTNISGLNITTQSIQYREGGYNTTVHQIPGMTTFSPITLQRGVLAGNDQAITWMRGLFAAAAGDGIATTTSAKTFRVNVDIYVMDHPNANAASENLPKMKFTVHNAWLTGLNYTDLNANDGSLFFESMQLVHEGLTVAFTKTTAGKEFESNRVQ
jgi:phage tail-like protein